MEVNLEETAILEEVQFWKIWIWQNIKLGTLHRNFDVWDEGLNACIYVQLRPTLCDPMDCSPPGSSVRGILQAGIVGWVAMPSSRGSSWPRDWSWVHWVSCTAGGFFTAEPWGSPGYRVPKALYISLHFTSVQGEKEMFPIQLRPLCNSLC